MGDRLAILACSGALPALIAEAYPGAIRIGFAGVPNRLEGAREHRFEKLGAMFNALRDEGVGKVVLAGSLARPNLDPREFDAATMTIAPRLTAAMAGGDDELLREVIAIFEEQGLVVCGAHELLPELVADAELQVGPAPSGAELKDAGRAVDILSALAPVDVGQGCVVAGGQCLGIETVQGTDALLEFVFNTPPSLRRGQRGVYVKAAKAGQDLRVDMPAIGPSTIRAVAAAGLAGALIEPGRVMMLDRQKTFDAVKETGIFLSALRVGCAPS